MDEQRIQQLTKMGLKFNGENFAGNGNISDFNVHHTEILCDNDHEWRLKIAAMLNEKLKRESKFIFLDLKVVNGEYEYNCKSVHITKCNDINFFAQRYAAEFYMDENVYRQDNVWYSQLGCVATSVEVVKEIPREHYEVLQEYLK